MDRSGLQRLIPIILVLIITVVAVAALISLGRTLFSGEGAQTTKPPVNTGKEALTSTLADRSVRMSLRGPIVADENFHSYTITVGPDVRNLTTYRGYLREQLTNEQITNNTKAYEQFVHALSRATLMDGTPLSGDANDTRGICAAGSLYEFEVLQGTNVVQKLWTTTCSGSKGSLKANLSQVNKLFQLQIPDFNAVVSKIKLNF